MRGKDLPVDDHVVRYVKPSLIRDDETVSGAAFCLRASEPNEKAYR